MKHLLLRHIAKFLFILFAYAICGYIAYGVGFEAGAKAGVAATVSALNQKIAGRCEAKTKL